MAIIVNLGACIRHVALQKGSVDRTFTGKGLAEALLQRVLHAGIAGSGLAWRLHGRRTARSGTLAEVGEIDLHLVLVRGRLAHLDILGLGGACGAVGAGKVDEGVDAGTIAVVCALAAAILWCSNIRADQRRQSDGGRVRWWCGGGSRVPTGLVVPIASPGRWRELVLGWQTAIVLHVALQLQQFVLHEVELLAHCVVIRRQLVDLALQAIRSGTLLGQGSVEVGDLALVGIGLGTSLVEGVLQVAVRLLHLLGFALAEGALGLAVLLLAFRGRVIGGRLATGLGARWDDIAVTTGTLVHGGGDVG